MPLKVRKEINEIRNNDKLVRPEKLTDEAYARLVLGKKEAAGGPGSRKTRDPIKI